MNPYLELDSALHPFGQAFDDSANSSYINPVFALELLAEALDVDAQHALGPLQVAQPDISCMHIGHRIHDIMRLIDNHHITLQLDTQCISGTLLQ